MIFLLVISYPLVGIAVLLTLRRLDPAGAGGRRHEIANRVAAATGALPALGLALLGRAGWSAEVPWLALGAQFGLTTTTQVFLLFTSILWMVAGLYAGSYHRHDERRIAFFSFYLLTLCGNLGLVLAQDGISFYVFFALMTYAGYGLVVHRRSASARRAANTYVVMAIAGELLILGGIWLAVHEAGSIDLAAMRTAIAHSGHQNVIIALLFVGFGVKAGTVLVHMWLPLAHPAAPTSASAVLSGTMIKAGLLGWIHFLPAGEVALPVWSNVLIGWGLFSAFFGVVVGVAQDDPKTNLAYSSISQMGVMTIALGVGLSRPEAWPAALSVLLVYAFSHALAKGTLFLGVGICRGAGPERWKRLVAIGGVFLAAVAIAGAPMTGGAIAKKALKNVSSFAHGPVSGMLEALLPLTAVATTVLLGRFLLLVWPTTREPKPVEHGMDLWWSWVFILSVVAAGVWTMVPWLAIEIPLPALATAYVWDGIWPIAAGAVLLLTAWFVQRRVPVRLHLPPGDVLWLLNGMLRRGKLAWAARMENERDVLDLYRPMLTLLESRFGRKQAASVEATLARRPVALAIYVLMVIAIVLAVMAG
jgi:formate hydrogenlyase subunit 3/multisubunit Na+/H+ antiporter MnhD subunit